MASAALGLKGPAQLKLTDEAMVALRQKFLLIDVNNDGKINASNLSKFYHLVGVYASPNEEEATQFFSSINVKELNYKQFLLHHEKIFEKVPNAKIDELLNKGKRPAMIDITAESQGHSPAPRPQPSPAKPLASPAGGVNTARRTPGLAASKSNAASEAEMRQLDAVKQQLAAAQQQLKEIEQKKEEENKRLKEIELKKEEERARLKSLEQQKEELAAAEKELKEIEQRKEQASAEVEKLHSELEAKRSESKLLGDLARPPSANALQTAAENAEHLDGLDEQVRKRQEKLAELDKLIQQKEEMLAVNVNHKAQLPPTPAVVVVESLAAPAAAVATPREASSENGKDHLEPGGKVSGDLTNSEDSDKDKEKDSPKDPKEAAPVKKKKPSSKKPKTIAGDKTKDSKHTKRKDKKRRQESLKDKKDEKDDKSHPAASNSEDSEPSISPRPPGTPVVGTLPPAATPPAQPVVTAPSAPSIVLGPQSVFIGPNASFNSTDERLDDGLLTQLRDALVTLDDALPQFVNCLDTHYTDIIGKSRKVAFAILANHSVTRYPPAEKEKISALASDARTKVEGCSRILHDYPGTIASSNQLKSQIFKSICDIHVGVQALLEAVEMRVKIVINDDELTEELLPDPITREALLRYFSRDKVLLKWEVFHHSLESVFSDHHFKTLQYLLDPWNTQYVSYKRIIGLVKEYGPLRASLAKLNQLITHEAFQGYFSDSETNSILQGFGNGTWFLTLNKARLYANLVWYQDDSLRSGRISFASSNNVGGSGHQSAAATTCALELHSGSQMNGLGAKMFQSVAELLAAATPFIPLAHPFTSKFATKSWYHGDITSDESQRLLAPAGDGSFLFRLSSKKGYLAISYVFREKVGHTLIKFSKSDDYENGQHNFKGLDALLQQHGQIFRYALDNRSFTRRDSPSADSLW